MEALHFSQMPVTTYQSTQHNNISEDLYQ